jgi:Fibronectin type III domain
MVSYPINKHRIVAQYSKIKKAIVAMSFYGFLQFLFFFLIISPSVQAQLFPVQTSVQIIPPYSVYLADYATPGNDKLKLILVQRDVSRPSYQVRLSFSIELNGKTILRTSPSFNPPPITLDPGIPTIISGVDLQPYLDSRNLDFNGYSRDEYERTKALPEGSYQICVTAYDYRRPDVAVSNAGCNFYWLAKSEPPMVNLPACATNIPIATPQQILFSWLPRNTTSPTAVADTEYEFALYEMRPAGRNPNDVVASSRPIFTTVTAATQVVYGLAEPILLKDLTYVWRVRAIDKNGRDQFRNNGYSEVCTFTLGGIDLNLLPVDGVQAKGETERRGKVWWEALDEAGKYKVNYKKAGSEDYEWFSEEATEPNLTFYELEPNTEYEVRLQAYQGENYGPYSEIVKFKTRLHKVYQCGDALPALPEPGKPLTSATKGTIVNVQGLELVLEEASNIGGAGVYKGKGRVSVPYLGGASFNAVFSNLFIDENRVATSGRIDFVTKAIDNWVEDKLAEQKREEREEQQKENKEKWKNTNFYEEVTYYDAIDIEDIRIENGKVIIEGTDALGNPVTITNDAIIKLADSTGKAIIIEDKNGDQWVVQPGGKVSKVPGGGLSPTMDVVVSEEALDIVKKALVSLREKEYTDSELKKLDEIMTTRKKEWDDYTQNHNSKIIQQNKDSEVNEHADDDGQQSLLFDFEEINASSKESISNADQLFREFCISQRNRNIGLWIISLSHQGNFELAAKIVSSEIKIEKEGSQSSVTEFIDKQRKLRVSEQLIVEQIKSEGIIRLLGNLLGGCR